MSYATTSLTEFVHAFEKLVERWRRQESEADFHSNQGLPTLAIKYSRILKDAARHYTLKIYKLFEKEYLDGLGGCSSTEVCVGENLYQFDVVMEERGSRASIVHLQHIPDKYIVHRWTKGVRDRVLSREKELCSAENADSIVVYRNHEMRSAYNMITQGQHNKETRAAVWKILNEGSSELNKLLHKLKLDDRSSSKHGQPDEERDESNEESQILNPARVRPIGVSNARLKGHFEKRKKKSSNAGRRKNYKTMGTSAHVNEDSADDVVTNLHVSEVPLISTAHLTSGPVLEHHGEMGVSNNHFTSWSQSFSSPILEYVHYELPNVTKESSVPKYNN